MKGTPGTTDEQAWCLSGAELRRLRHARGWSLAEMARQVPYSKSYLSKLETGAKRITPDIARYLDEALGTGGALAAVPPGPESPIPADGEPTGIEVCPYPGLAAFGPDQARWFFGRDQITTHLISQLDARLAGGGPIAVVASSGAGKSSLLAAGLIPALAGGALPGSRDWLVVTATPGAHPLTILAARVAERTGVDPAAAAEASGDPDRFAAFLTRVVTGGKLEETPSSARIVLIIDQFEEIFTECRQDTERRAFIASLRAAAASRAVLVVLGVRADFYAQCLASHPMSAALAGHLPLEPMNLDQLREAITRPAQTEGLELEPGLVELLLRDLGVPDDADTGAAGYDPGSLPLLAHALRVSWQQREGRMLTVAGYRRTGGIRQALANTAERAYTRLNPADQQVARKILLRLVNVSDYGTNTRRRLPRTRLDQLNPGSTDAIDGVLETFSRARLITLDADHVQITHEALLNAWPRLRQWIDTDRAGNLIRQELDEAAAVWERDRRDAAGLYRGSRLEAARVWATSKPNVGDLSPAASAFLAASTAQERHAVRLRRAVLVVLSVLLLVASGTAIVALKQNATAQRERDTAILNQIIAQADRLRSTDVSLAAQLDLIAYRMRPTRDLYTDLITMGNAALSTPLIGHTDAVYAVTAGPDGHTLASGSDDQTVRLWNVTDPAHPTPLGPPLTGHTGFVRSVAFSPDGHTLASGSADRTVRLWNVTDPAHPTPVGQPLTGHTDLVGAVAFSPDGHTLASGSTDRTVRLWNVTDRAPPPP
ncbi:MAG: helix-turn-helix domain-containing protein, partial [Pseudonocardiaceae bacterium]